MSRSVTNKVIGAKSSRPARSHEARAKACQSCDIKYTKPSTCSVLGEPRYQVVLDLDASVINSLAIPDELKQVPKDFQNKFKYIDMQKYYRIFERPFLQDFLDYLFSRFDVSVFTAADKDYALFIVDKIILKKPGRKLRYFFFGDHSGISENIYKSPKDLRMFWDMFELPGFCEHNTVIIDDLDLVFKANPHNAIWAPKFELLDDKNKVNYGLEHDNFLLQVIPLLESRRKKFLNWYCTCSSLDGFSRIKTIKNM